MDLSKFFKRLMPQRDVPGEKEPDDETKNTTEMLHQAMDLAGDENYLAAIDLLSEVISIDPNNAQAWFERGMANLELDNDNSALSDLDRALEIAPDFPGAREWRAQLLSSLGRFEEAAQEQKAILERSAGAKESAGVNPQAWADCASSFIAAQNNEQAVALLESYFSHHSAYVSTYAVYETAPMRALSKLLIQSGDFSSAVEFAQKAYESEHRVPADILAYALALEAAGDKQKARVYAEEAMGINDQMPGCKEIYERLKN